MQHGGRAVHPDLGGGQPISSSDVPIDAMTWVNGRQVKHVQPRAATKDDMKRVIEQFRTAAELGKKAGYDGV